MNSSILKNKRCKFIKHKFEKKYYEIKFQFTMLKVHSRKCIVGHYLNIRYIEVLIKITNLKYVKLVSTEK